MSICIHKAFTPCPYVSIRQPTAETLLLTLRLCEKTAQQGGARSASATRAARMPTPIHLIVLTRTHTHTRPCAHLRRSWRRQAPWQRGQTPSGRAGGHGASRSGCWRVGPWTSLRAARPPERAQTETVPVLARLCLLNRLGCSACAHQAVPVLTSGCGAGQIQAGMARARMRMRQALEQQGMSLRHSMDRECMGLQCMTWVEEERGAVNWTVPMMGESIMPS